MNPLINKYCYILLACIGCSILAACSNHQHPNKKIFYYNEQSGIASLDPAFAKNQSIMWAVHQLYNTLVEVDEQMQIKPSLAKSWVISSDRKSIVFTLRNDVFFVNDRAFKNGKGKKLTATDVVYSFERILHTNTASPGAWIFNNRVDSVKPFIAINDSLFKLQLLQPFQPILGILSMQYCSIVAREAVAYYGNNFRQHPVGTGPFAFVAWEEGQALIFKKNNNYFEKDSLGNALPYLDGIKISFFDSKATEFLAFQQHKIDFINDIDASFKDEVLTKTGQLKPAWQGKVVLQKHPYLNTEYLGILIDSTNPLVHTTPLRLQKIRQAINYGFDRRKMMLYLRNSIGTPAESGFVPKGLPSFNDSIVKGYSYNPNKAKQLLIEAGYGQGIEMPSITLLTVPVYADLATYISNELNLIGIHVKVETVQKSLLLQQTAKGQVLFFRASWIADYPDAENYLSVFYGKNPAPPNYTRFNNAAFNSLYTQALATTNDSLRFKMYQQMDNIIINQAPIVPLWYDMAIHVVHTNITGFYPNSLNMLELRKVKKK